MKLFKNLFFIVFFILTTESNVLAQIALDFDGLNDAVLIQPNSVFDLYSGTIEAWIKTSDAGSSYRAIVVKQLAYGIFLKGNELGTYDWNTSNWRGTGSFLNDNTWHHIAMTFNNVVEDNTIIYLDGLEVLSTTITIDSQSKDLTIGKGVYNNTYASQQFNGVIDEVRVWDTVRSQAEIQNTMNTELIGNESGLIAYYNFNQGNPNDNNSNETTLLDSSSNNINGALINFELSGTYSNWVSTNNILSIDHNVIDNEKITLYPNPTSNFINIKGLTNSNEYTIYNSLGTEILKGTISENKSILISNFANGIYFLKLKSGEYFKFIKE